MGRALEIKKELLEKKAMQAIEELARIAELEEKFGSNEDFPDGTVIRWDQRYQNGNQKYSFAAIKAVGHWYTTGIFQHHRITFEELVEKHLQHAVDGEVWYCTEWTVI